MRRFRDRDGTDRIWYDDDEIEEIMVVELKKAALFPSVDNPAVDIERFIEGHLQTPFDQYAELDPEVLGVTEFVRGDRPRIRINRDLTGSALDEDDSPLGIIGRWRATVAHEASHVILHAILFHEAPGQQGLFGPAQESPPEAGRVFRSLKRDVSFSKQCSDWREAQANKGMAALLMPRWVFLQVSDREFEVAPFPEPRTGIDEPEVRAYASRIAAHFQVSREAALIRLRTLDVLGRYHRPRLL